MSITCKYCNKSLKLEDIPFNKYEARRTIETVGIVTVEKKGNVVVTDKINCGGLIVRGKVKGDVDEPRAGARRPGGGDQGRRDRADDRRRRRRDPRGQVRDRARRRPGTPTGRPRTGKPRPTRRSKLRIGRGAHV